MTVNKDNSKTTLVPQLLALAMEQTNCDAVTVLLSDPLTGRLLPASFDGDGMVLQREQDHSESKDGQFAFYRAVLESSTPVQSRDITTESTVLSVPIVQSGRTALLNFIRFDNRSFSLEERDQALRFAEVIRPSLPGSDGDPTEDGNNYRSLLELSRTINEKLRFEEALEAFCEAVSLRLGFSEMAVLRFEPGEGRFSMIYGHGIKSEKFDWIMDSLRQTLLMPSGDNDSASLIFDDGGTRKKLSFINLAVERRNVGILTLISSDETTSASGKADLLYLKAVAAQLAALIERNRLMTELEDERNKLSALNEINRGIAEAGLDEEKIAHAILPSLKTHFSAVACGMWIPSPRKGEGRITIHSSGRLKEKDKKLMEEYLSGEPDPSHLPIHLSNDGKIARISMYSSRKNELAGMLLMKSSTSSVLDLSDRTLLNLISSELGLVLQNVMLFKEHERLAYTDALTGAFNHRYFQETLEREFQRSRRYKLPLSMLIMDIDHFKAFNDNYGHMIGDLVLSGVADLLRKSVRDIDTVARYGGEEFVAVLPQTSLDSALEIAERIRVSICEHDFIAPDVDEPLKVSMSLGISQFRSTVRDRHVLIQLADEALYYSKENGRNRVSVHDGQKPGPPIKQRKKPR